MKKQTHLSVPPLLFPCPTPFLLKQLQLRLSLSSILMTASDACGQHSPPPAACSGGCGSGNCSQSLMSSSSMVMSLMGVYVKVGSNAVAITENGLHLQAMSLPIAPNHHNCRKTVLWHFFVQHLYPASIYCCALYRMKLTSWSRQGRCRGHVWLVWLSSTSKPHE
jgi:hypothetical protein